MLLAQYRHSFVDDLEVHGKAVILPRKGSGF